jgi:DNA modification methylase
MKEEEQVSDSFVSEETTVWSFPIRGTWATHKPDYRGNFAPQVARNVLLRYSKEGEKILDPMVGSGTTLIEARLLNRHALGLDINQNAVEITKERLKFAVENLSKQGARLGDVRDLGFLKDESIDLILTHPPYANIIKYSKGKNPDDLSSISGIPKFLDELEKGIREMFRVLKPNKYCAILIGDTRKAQHYVPLSHFVLERCLKAGFVLKEQIIKTQHNTKYASRWQRSAGSYKFYLIMHEHLFVFRKPTSDEKLTKIKYSTHWQGNEAALQAAIKHIELLLAAHSISEDDIVRALKKKSKVIS